MLECAQLPCGPLQLPHKRNGNTSWRLKSSGMFAKSQVLSVESSKALRKGEGLTMDYGPDRLDNSLLLDYGVLDTTSPKVCAVRVCPAELGCI
jgi:hypothetical protein